MSERHLTLELVLSAPLQYCRNPTAGLRVSACGWFGHSRPFPVPFFHAAIPGLCFFGFIGGNRPLFRVCVWIGGIPFLFIMTTLCVQGGLGPVSRTVDIREAEQKAESMLRLTEPDIGAGLILFAGGKYKRRLTCFGNERDFKFYVNLHCRYNR